MEAIRDRGREPLVLIADDDADARAIFAACLAHVGFQVALAVDGTDAAGKAFLLGPDAIVMDLAMPGVSGLDAARKIRADPRTAHVPIIFVTGHASKDIERAVRAVGGAAYLTKPCLPEVLAAEIRRHLSGSQAGPADA